MLPSSSTVSQRTALTLVLLSIVTYLTYYRLPLIPRSQIVTVQDCDGSRRPEDWNKRPESQAPSSATEDNLPVKHQPYPRPQDVYANIDAQGQEPNLPLPEDYEEPSPAVEWCENALGHSYLYNFRDHHHSYCQKDFGFSKVECFTSAWNPDRPSTFCLTENVVARPAKQREGDHAFGIQCEQRNWIEEGFTDTVGQGPEGSGTDLFHMPIDMFNTGLGTIVKENFMVWDKKEQISEFEKKALKTCAERSKEEKQASGYKILIKRDPSQGAHHWHSMMEIIQLHWVIDAMRITPNPNNDNEPYFTASDLKNSQIIILDDQMDGPFFELWSLVAKKPPLRLSDIDRAQDVQDEPACLDKVLVPLAGGSNPMWSLDWRPQSCVTAPNLDTFVRRVLKHYDIRDRRPLDAPIRVTVIERHTNRQLKNSDTLFEAVRRSLPDERFVEINFVDFGSLPFSEQLQIAQETDVLLGVHGAGLALGMFMPKQGAMVEILPSGFWHKGFRNMAHLRGHRYYSAHSEPFAPEQGTWQTISEVEIAEERFQKLFSAAVLSMFQSRMLNEDVV